MTNTTNQVFTNTCGKIFRNHIIFAASNKESYSYDEIKSISFSSQRKLSDLLFALLPSSLFLFTIFLKKDDTFLRALFIILGLAGVALTIFKAKTRYFIIVKISGEKSLTVRAVSKREAERFIGQANTMLQKHRQAAQDTKAQGRIDIQRIMPVASFE